MKMVSLLIFTFGITLAGTLLGGQSTWEKIRNDYLPQNARYSKPLSDATQEVYQKLSEEKGGNRLAPSIIVFTFSSSFEEAMQALQKKGLELQEWDQEAARRVRPPASRSKKGISWDPLDLPNFWRATAASEGNLFVLQSHRFDPKKKIWRPGTTLEVYVPSLEPTGR